MGIDCYKIAFVAFVISLYGIISALITFRINTTSKYLVDELFHIPQGLAYCNHEFKRWDPKITTLPGLYLYSTIFCSPLQCCNSLCLRLTNVFASCINIILFILLRQLLKPSEPFGKVMLNSLNIALLPPLYFFSQVYYTDVPSLTVVLGLIYFGLSGRPTIASYFGLAAIICRQTNIVYVGFILGLQGLGLLQKIAKSVEISTNQRKSDLVQRDQRNSWPIQKKFLDILYPISWSTLMKFVPEILIKLGPYCFTIATFMCFILWNGGITVGDKDAHTITLHIPQIFYFSIFALLFSWPHFLQYVKEFLQTTIKFPFRITLILSAIMVVVASNTIVHPYLVADNRHYTFYMWRYFFKTPLLRMFWVPIYCFALFSLHQVCRSLNDVRFTLMYIVTLVAAVSLQKLLDVRYFLVPFVLLRLHYPQTLYWVQCLEMGFLILINYLTYGIFFTKEIYWQDFTEAQRLIW